MSSPKRDECVKESPLYKCVCEWGRLYLTSQFCKVELDSI